VYDSNRKLVDAEFLEFDKYGRGLLKLTADGTDVSDAMVKDGYAVAYFGGTKGVAVDG